MTDVERKENNMKNALLKVVTGLRFSGKGTNACSSSGPTLRFADWRFAQRRDIIGRVAWNSIILIIYDRDKMEEIAQRALNDGAMIVNPAHLSKEDAARLLLAAE